MADRTPLKPRWEKVNSEYQTKRILSLDHDDFEAVKSGEEGIPLSVLVFFVNADFSEKWVAVYPEVVFRRAPDDFEDKGMPSISIKQRVNGR